MNRSSSALAMGAPFIDTSRYPEAPSLEDRFGARIGSALSERAAAAPHDVSERLRVAREQALARAKARRSVAQPALAPALQIMGNGLAWQPPSWLRRAAAVLPLLILAAGLVAIDEWYDRAQINAAAEVDVALLTDDLPVHAYSDPGFTEFLKNPAN